MYSGFKIDSIFYSISAKLLTQKKNKMFTIYIINGQIYLKE